MNQFNLGTKQTHKRSLELTNQFIAGVSADELKALINKHEAFANAGSTYDEYINSLQYELNPMNFGKRDTGVRK